jgi:3'(2'),5'-bisphosphate nucleotidase
MTEALPDDDALAELFAALALDAGAAIMRVFHGGNPNARLKKDASPVSDADILAEEIILKGLARALPHLPVVAEEASESGALPKIDGGDFILVDALDGSKEFLNRRDSFTVNIAMIRNGAPTVGVVFAPARSEFFLAGGKAWTFSAAPGGKVPPRDDWRLLHTRPMPERDAVAVASLSHRDPETDAFLTRLPVKDVVSTGSSRKFCLVAAGQADVYPRFGPTREWDTAAGDAVLRRAGGIAVDRSGETLVYGKEAGKFVNCAFIAWGDPRAAAFYGERAVLSPG